MLNYETNKCKKIKVLCSSPLVLGPESGPLQHSPLSYGNRDVDRRLTFLIALCIYERILFYPLANEQRVFIP